MRLIERVVSRPTAVDEAAFVVRGVKIIGHKSANGRTYTRECLAKAKSLYEGAPAYVDHSKGKERSYLDRLGEFRNVQEQTDGLYGDLHYNPENPAARAFLHDAKHNTRGVGFSHTADGKTNRRGDVVEELTEVLSVDLVAGPATTKSLFEQEQTVKVTLKEIIAKAKDQADKPIVQVLREMEGEMGDMPIEVASDATEGNQTREALKQLIMAVVDDESLDSAGIIGKIKAILKMKDSIEGGGATETETEETPTEEQKVPAQMGLEEQVKHLELKDRCRDMLTEAGVAGTKLRVEALIGLKTDALREQMIAEWKDSDKRTGSSGARSVATNKLKEQGEKKKPALPKFKTNEDRLRFMRTGSLN